MTMVSLERRGPKWKRSLTLGNATEKNWEQWLEVKGKQRVHDTEALFNTWSPPTMQKYLTKLRSLPLEVFKQKLNQCLFTDGRVDFQSRFMLEMDDFHRLFQL